MLKLRTLFFVAVADSQLRDIGDDLKSSTFDMLTFTSTWSGFSNHRVSSLPLSGAASSVEAIHDQLHVAVGGNYGYMSDPGMAGEPRAFLSSTISQGNLPRVWPDLGFLGGVLFAFPSLSLSLSLSQKSL
jgi:hypothetical protein